MATGDSARAILAGMLDEWGLSSLTEWAWGQLTAGSTAEQVVYEARKTDAYRVRFAGNTRRTQAGYTPLSEAEYLAYEQQARQLMRSYGMPPGFYDEPTDFAAWIGGDVSVVELRDRIDTAQAILQEDPPEARAEAERLYGITAGDMLAYALDPDRAVTTVRRRLEAARIAGAAARGGMSFTAAEAERLAGGTSSIDQAQQMVTQVGRAQGLTIETPGEAGDLTTADTIEAALGSADAIERVRRRAAERDARFSEGGSLIGSNTVGALGAGTAR